MTAQPLAQPVTADPWGEARDLELLHSGATEAILGAVAELRAQAGRPRPLLVLGAAGIGKTHLFSRLRRKLGTGAILVHVRPITSAAMTPRYVLGQILQQLARTSGGARQIDSLVGSILAVGWDGSPDQAAVGLDLLQRVDARGRSANLEHFQGRLRERMPDLDDGCLELLLKAPLLDPLALGAALAWLGGQDISETQGARIGVQQPLAEDRVLPALRTVARLAAPSAPLVVVFDQLENLVQGPDPGRILAYGNLVMDLVDEVQDLVIVQMALDTEWEQGIRPALTLAQQARVLGPKFLLDMPTPAEAEGLLRLWLADHPRPAGPFPWPFAAQEITDLAGRSATPRQLLQELQQRLEDAPAPAQETGEAMLAEVWETLLGKVREEIDARDRLEQGAVPEALADGLLRLVRLVPGLALVAAEGPERLFLATPRGQLLVALVHQAHHRSIASALDRLGAAQGPRLGLREDWRPFKPTWKVARGKREALVQASAGWHWLARQDVERLLALDLLLKSAVSRDLSGPGGIPFEPAAVEAWARLTLAPEAWAIARTLVAGGAAEGETPAASLELNREPPAPLVPAPMAAGPEGGAILKLRQLRVASVDRLVRECRQEGSRSARAELLAELRSAGPAVTWIGETIVCLER